MIIILHNIKWWWWFDYFLVVFFLLLFLFSDAKIIFIWNCSKNLIWFYHIVLHLNLSGMVWGWRAYNDLTGILVVLTTCILCIFESFIHWNWIWNDVQILYYNNLTLLHNEITFEHNHMMRIIELRDDVENILFFCLFVLFLWFAAITDISKWVQWILAVNNIMEHENFIIIHRMDV